MSIFSSFLPSRATIVAVLALSAAGRAPAAADVDLSHYESGGAITVETPDPDTLAVEWSDKAGTRYHLDFNLVAGEPLVGRVAAKTADGEFQDVARDIDPRYRVTLGNRVPKTSAPYVFFERIDANQPAPVAHLSQLDATSVRVESESETRVKIVFSPLRVNGYEGELACIVYAGSPMVQFQATMTVTDPWVAYIFDGLFYGDLQSIAYRDQNGVFQTRTQGQIAATTPGTEAAIAGRHRTMMARFPGGVGTLAAMAPPHMAMYPTDFSNNFGYLQAGKTFFGTRMSPSADQRYRPWIDAPNGATQKMNVFLLIGTGTPQETLDRVLTYTNGDFYKPVDGHYTLAVHFHPEMVMEWRSRKRDLFTPFKQAMKAVGVQIANVQEFHGPGNPFNNTEPRLSQLRDMFTLCAQHSDDEFLFLPSEEYNNFFGGHWSYMFPKPVYFTAWPGQGGRTFRQTNVVSDGVTYPVVYQVGDSARMLQLLRDEGGIAWASHPRVKGSRFQPDGYVNTDFYRDPLFHTGGWKAMPADFSKDRLGYRAFALMDDTAQWGYRKFQFGETDTFEAHPNHELYTHLNVNYVQLPGMPAKDDWTTVVDALKTGRFFTTTGEVLIHSWNVTDEGVSADVEWYFPPAFAEITWGNDDGVHKVKTSLADREEFGRDTIQVDADLSDAKWVRFEFWDVARNGAFTQPHWLENPAEPAVVAGRTTGFTLFDAESDAPVAGYDPIPPNAVLDRAVLPESLAIRVNTSPWIMDRVMLNFDGATITETNWPYTVAPTTEVPGVGDSPGYDYAPLNLASGAHTLTATPYRGSTAGQPLTLTFTVTGSPPPAAPGGVTAEAGNRTVELKWSAVPGAATYNIKRALASGGPYSTIGSTGGTGYSDSGLTNGTPYFYVISAVGSSEGKNSAPVAATPGRMDVRIEHFTQGVEAGADVPIGTATGWRALGKSAGGAVVDYTSSIPVPLNSPNIANNNAGANGTTGYLVMGLNSVVNPVLAWVDVAEVLDGSAFAGVSFFTRNGSASNSVRVAVRIGENWYVSAQTFSDGGTNSAWTAQDFVFSGASSAWRTLDPSTLAIGAPSSTPLSPSAVTAVGVFAAIQTEKVRMDEFRIIASSLTAFQRWQIEHYGSVDNPAAAPHVVPGADGLTNLFRYALNLSPTESAAARLPTAGRVTAGGRDYLSLAYLARANAADVRYVVEVSGHLTSWGSGPSFTTLVGASPAGAGMELVSVRDNVPMDDALRRFIRLKVLAETE